MLSNGMEDYSEFAEELADLARSLALQHFRKTVKFERKEDESPVTIADKAIERAMREAIERRYPTHGVFGEETGKTEGGKELWVLDPIDGTKSFLTGMPLFGALIALLQNGEPSVGVIEMPALGERWVGKKGGTTLNGDPAVVSNCKVLADARVYTSSPDFFPSAEDWERYDRMSRLAAIRRFGGDCYQYALLASGFCDLVVEASLMPYDFLALVPVIENAGGRITDWDGKPLTVDSGEHVVAAASPWLHDEALKALAR
ncbi:MULTISPECIES: histidinol-phosphatase [unclassified Rhizobium]|uniref:histidinol-phosphatase n=1 Tax=Hyphomicrobiales TaxID=356 RepID=UPI000646DD1F|nr:histidinol-phosphatase [Rhizobium sp. WW_1]RKD74077.1 myo-inositol-1(or 4)-monophosphatase [Rhizobium sp. WW_1]